jgi:hypothetical protein
VATGVIGEGIFEVLVSRADARIRTYDETAIELADQKVGAAAISAHNAAVDATNAESDAGVAHNLAVGSQNEANAVGEKAKDLDRQLGTTKKQLADAQAEEAKERQDLINLTVCLAPRVLSYRMDGEKTSSEPLLPMAGQKVFIEFVPFDAEAKRAALSLAWIPMATVRLTARINARRFSQDLSPFNAS